MKIVKWADSKLIVFAVVMTIAGASVLAYVVTHIHQVTLLDPKGPIARQELHLAVIAVLLMLIVVIPVFILTAGIAWRYRATNESAHYAPDWDRDNRLEALWWGIPCIIITLLAVITWTSTHELDPYKPLVSKNPQLTVQVISLDWKWLFVYPQQNIATVNVLDFPKATPVDFEITSDAPMNSFWIPQLGGQIYAMPGMSTQLHLMADGVGTYNGSSANISGVGFAGMTFKANSLSDADFASWVNSVKRSPNHLTASSYNSLARPSENNPVTYFASVADGLYDDTVMKYMPASPNNSTSAIPMASGSSNMSGMVMQ
ncbi:MAG TPA: ubiquinol oxidase subunit II [Candidatus Saccharimonadia bacterium]|nr:ubiquinol oxidase subunit II [Candidatus Saccharimonadia bacterium]